MQKIEKSKIQIQKSLKSFLGLRLARYHGGIDPHDLMAQPTVLFLNKRKFLLAPLSRQGNIKVRKV